MATTYTTHLAGMVSLRSQSLIDEVDGGSLLRPVARVKVQNVDTLDEYEIGEVVNYSVRVSGEQGSDSFQITVKDVGRWYKHGSIYPDLLEASLKRRVKIEQGYVVGGVAYYVPVFVGIALTDQIHVGPQNRSLTLSGYGLENLLIRADGSYPTAYTGGVKDLIAYFLEAAGITNYWLAFDDYQIDGIQVSYTNAYVAISQLISPLGNVEYFFDQEGVFVAQVQGITTETEFDLDGTNLLKYLSRSTVAPRIKTVVDVSGADDASSTVIEASNAILTKYGRNKLVFSSSFITTLTEAQSFGNNILAEALLWENTLNLRCPFLPYLRPGSKVLVTDADSQLSADTVRVKRISLQFNAGKTSQVNIVGIKE